MKDMLLGSKSVEFVETAMRPCRQAWITLRGCLDIETLALLMTLNVFGHHELVIAAPGHTRSVR